MAAVALKSQGRKRTASKEERRAQLIQATILSVARNGLSDTTMATVSSEAGLSQGIINLHFQTKDRLLTETLRFLADEYRQAWKQALAESGDDPAEKLAALVTIDFKPPICDRNKLAVWFAFWGETKSRPTYRKICAERDAAYRDELEQICEELIEQGGYEGIDAQTVAASISTMTSGLWLEILTAPRQTSRERARDICMAYLSTCFPEYF
jgi:TetR/AcrR family transcriptional repressor of bet genes